MIEAAILFEPLGGVIFVVRIYEGTVDELQVLSLTLRRDEFMSLLINRSIALHDAEPEPSLLNLGILRISQMIVSVDTGHNIRCDGTVVIAQLVQEDELRKA